MVYGIFEFLFLKSLIFKDFKKSFDSPYPVRCKFFLDEFFDLFFGDFGFDMGSFFSGSIINFNELRRYKLFLNYPNVFCFFSPSDDIFSNSDKEKSIRSNQRMLLKMLWDQTNQTYFPLLHYFSCICP